MSFRSRDQHRNSSVSPKGEVGEIDTRAPFRSVKAAVNLFGEVAVSREKLAIKRRSSENVLEKETQLLLAQRELNKIKKKLESAETTKVKALAELNKAKVTLQDLTTKLTNVRVSKQSAMEAAEAVKDKAKQLEKALSQKAIGFEAWKQELEHARKEYTTTVKELDASKQELNKIRQDFDSALEAKLAAFQAAAEAQRSAKSNSERVSELSKEIETMKASIEQLKLATLQAQEEQTKVMGEREAQLSFYKTAKEEAQMKLKSLNNEYNPERTQSLEAKLAETNEEIQVLQEQMKKLHASEMDSVRVLNLEIKGEKKTLHDLTEEENSLKNLVASLRKELEEVKKEQEEVKKKEQAAEALAAKLTSELQGNMGDAGPMEDKEADVCHEINSKIQKLSLETEDARREVKEMIIKTQELKQEAEKSRTVAGEMEKKLELVQQQAEEAKAAEKRAIEEMKILSDMQGRVSTSEPNGKIVLTVEDFAALSGKIKESEDLIERTEAAAMAQLEAINTRKNEVDKKVEANLKAIEEIKAATDMALRNAEMADSAKLAVEGELKRWRQEEQKGLSDLDYSDNSPRTISLRI